MDGEAVDTGLESGIGGKVAPRRGVNTCGSDARYVRIEYAYEGSGAERTGPMAAGWRVRAWVEPGGERGDFARRASFFSLARPA